MLLQKNTRIFLLKVLFEGMTTLPFKRKNNLLSLLRGYDLPIKHNFLNSALLGFGKHHHHHHHHHKKEKKTLTSKPEESEERYIKFLTTVEPALKEYFNFFITNIHNDSFWYSNKFFDALCAFTRYFVASKTTTSSEFFSNIESFLVDIANSVRYARLLEDMDSFADKYKISEELPKEYNNIKVESGDAIQTISRQCLSQDVLNLDNQTIINLILDCIVYSTEEPQEFESKFDTYQRRVTNSYEKDIQQIFSEDLQDTAHDDELESDGEFDSEDESFVVPDDEEYIEYEEKPVKKRRKLVASEEDEVTGSGFYEWWW